MVTQPNVKINLGLNVLRKRPDGYHDLDTLFVPYFAIHDTLEIIKGDDWSETSASLFARYGTDAVAEEGEDPVLAQAVSEDGKLMMTIARSEGVDWDPLKDLCAKAYAMLDADFSLPPVKIFLEKTSPVGAGLGGGSSDAAFTLKMLSEMFGLGLSNQQLASYAARLGSDCAFFVYNSPMFGTGRGEILEPYPVSALPFGERGKTTKTYELQVIVPEGVSVSTAEAYKGIVPRDRMDDSSALMSLKDALAQPISAWRECLVNDFETTVFAHHPELPAIKQSLYDSGAVYAAMSGSGSALFAIYPR